jgi:tetratricopeptide (TPR) repeat protein
MRFRAPDELNDIIRHLPRSYPGVYLADTKKLFEAQSIAGIIGKETMLEHVHPNLSGYAIMSESFYQQIRSRNIVPEKETGEISFKQLLAEMPVTKVDSLYGAYQIMMLKSGWPFNEAIPSGYRRGDTQDEKLAGALAVDRLTWRAAMDELFRTAMASGDKYKALKATEAVLLENPYSVTYYIYAGRLSFDCSDIQSAEFYFKKAYELEPGLANAKNLYLLCLKSDLPEKALSYFTILKSFGEHSASPGQTEELLKNIIRLKKNISTEKQVKTLIADYYHQLGADEAAALYSEYKNIQHAQ